MTADDDNTLPPTDGTTPIDDNIVSLPTGAARERMIAEKARLEQARLEQARQQQEKAAHHEPLFHKPLLNIPPVTKYMLLAFFIVHLLTDLMLDDRTQYEVFRSFGFVPGYYTGALPFGWEALVGPFTFTFLHGSWTHILLNGFMMMAFGTGVERWIGGKRLFVFFMLCNLCAALAQFVFDPLSTAPVIGASGGLSGLFAAILLMMQKEQGLGAGNRYGIMPFVLLWIAISVVFGLMGGPNDSTIAWAAHIGGFLAGFVLFKPVMKARFLN